MQNIQVPMPLLHDYLFHSAYASRGICPVCMKQQVTCGELDIWNARLPEEQKPFHMSESTNLVKGVSKHEN